MSNVTDFDANVIDAVIGHMNGDHPEDSLLIARAFGCPEATESVMVGLDRTAGVWRVTDANGQHEVRVDWPGGQISERPEIRSQVVALYQAACEKLGVPARSEHAAEGGASHHGHGGGAHGEVPHGHGSDSANPHGAAQNDDTFSAVIRTATRGDHSDSEGATIMEDIFRMKASRDDYVALVVQHYFMYEALEEASKLLADDARFAALHPAALQREAALAEDLEFLLGENWREQISPVPATAAYASRIREVAAEGWLPGLIAHHYTRYLGDLSGGQMVAKRMQKQHGFEREGVAFYDFTELGEISDFKEIYRTTIDVLGQLLSDDERQRMIDEVRLAYRFNTEVFIDMQRAREPLPA